MADLEALADIRDDLDRFVQRLERVERTRPAATSGTDEESIVTVRIDQGGLIKDVMVERQWTSRVEPEELGSLVLEAYAAATTSGTQAWGQALAEDADEPEPATRPLPPRSESVSARLSEQIAASPDSARTGTTRTADLVADLRRDLDRVTAEIEELSRTEHEATDQGATVVVLGGGALTAVSLDREWATSTSSSNLEQRIFNAYRSAHRRATSRTVQDILANSRIGEIQRILDDRAALADYLGLA